MQTFLIKHLLSQKFQSLFAVGGFLNSFQEKGKRMEIENWGMRKYITR